MSNDLQLKDDINHQRHEWAVEYIGWAVMGLVLIAALLGLFGGGPLSSRTAGQPDSDLWIDYERFGRFQAPSQIRVHFRPTSPDATSVRIGISRDFYETMEVEVQPQPSETVLSHDRATLRFPVMQGTAPAAVTLQVKPKSRGERQATFWLDDSQHLGFSMFVYP